MGIFYRLMALLLGASVLVGLFLLVLGKFDNKQELKDTIERKEAREEVQDEVNRRGSGANRDRLSNWVLPSE